MGNVIFLLALGIKFPFIHLVGNSSLSTQLIPPDCMHLFSGDLQLIEIIHPIEHIHAYSVEIYSELKYSWRMNNQDWAVFWKLLVLQGITADCSSVQMGFQNLEESWRCLLSILWRMKCYGSREFVTVWWHWDCCIDQQPVYCKLQKSRVGGESPGLLTVCTQSKCTFTFSKASTSTHWIADWCTDECWHWNHVTCWEAAALARGVSWLVAAHWECLGNIVNWLFCKGGSMVAELLLLHISTISQ